LRQVAGPSPEGSVGAQAKNGRVHAWSSSHSWEGCVPRAARYGAWLVAVGWAAAQLARTGTVHGNRCREQFMCAARGDIRTDTFSQCSVVVEVRIPEE